MPALFTLSLGPGHSLSAAPRVCSKHSLINPLPERLPSRRLSVFANFQHVTGLQRKLSEAGGSSREKS